MQKSTVKWFDAKKGYGFIDHPGGGDDVFVHYSQIISTKDFKTLRTGQEVEFDLNDGPKGLHALDVKPLSEEEGEGTKKADASAEQHATGDAETAETASPASVASAGGDSTEAASSSDGQASTDEDEDDEWAWNEEEWTDEHGNPPDPMAGPTF